MSGLKPYQMHMILEWIAGLDAEEIAEAGGPSPRSQWTLKRNPRHLVRDTLSYARITAEKRLFPWSTSRNVLLNRLREIREANAVSDLRREFSSWVEETIDRLLPIPSTAEQAWSSGTSEDLGDIWTSAQYWMTVGLVTSGYSRVTQENARSKAIARFDQFVDILMHTNGCEGTPGHPLVRDILTVGGIGNRIVIAWNSAPAGARATPEMAQMITRTNYVKMLWAIMDVFPQMDTYLIGLLGISSAFAGARDSAGQHRDDRDMWRSNYPELLVRLAAVDPKWADAQAYEGTASDAEFDADFDDFKTWLKEIGDAKIYVAARARFGSGSDLRSDRSFAGGGKNPNALTGLTDAVRIAVSRRTVSHLREEDVTPIAI